MCIEKTTAIMCINYGENAFFRSHFLNPNNVENSAETLTFNIGGGGGGGGGGEPGSGSKYILSDSPFLKTSHKFLHLNVALILRFADNNNVIRRNLQVSLNVRMA